MTAVESLPLSLTQQSLVKMDDRKRPSPYDSVDSAPPLKRQATNVNGASKSHKDDDMPWKDDLEVSPTSIPRPPFLRNTLTRCFTNRDSRKMQYTGRCKSTKEKRTLLRLS